MHDHGMVGRPPLRGIKARDRCGAGRIRTQAVHRFSGEGDQPSGAQDLRRAAYVFVHEAMLYRR
jgi:hypothetical protein